MDIIVHKSGYISPSLANGVSNFEEIWDMFGTQEISSTYNL